MRTLAATLSPLRSSGMRPPCGAFIRDVISKATKEKPAASRNGVRCTGPPPTSANKPPSAGPATKPTPMAAPRSPIYWARFSGGDRSAIIAWMTPVLPAANPAISRAANIETISADNANHKLAAVPTSNETASTQRRPK